MGKTLSITAQNIVKDGTAYSNCLYSNDFNTPFIDLLKYEVLELGNMTILNSCSELYDIEMGATVIDSINNIFKYFVDKFHSEALYCTWVTSQWAVKDFGPAKDETYEIFMPARVDIACDMSTDGVLVVSPDLFVAQKFIKKATTTYNYYPYDSRYGYGQGWEGEY